MRRTALTALAVALLAPPGVAHAAALEPCTTEHWVGSWLSVPSDAAHGAGITSLIDASANPKLPLSDATTRSILSPTLSGNEIRVHLSNRFGSAPVTFERVAIAHSGDGASVVPGSSVPLTFGGKATVTAAPGQDVVSDPVAFGLEAFRRTAVSAYVREDIGKPTTHYTARQTSYATVAGAGDHVTDEAAGAFSVRSTSRPFVYRIDVRAPRSVGAVLAFGDSITDGYASNSPAIIPETAGTVDVDGRYPDVLARRLAAAGRRVGVLNAGISGNKVLSDAAGGPFEAFGPSALNRLDLDVPADAGVTTVIVLEGINDLGDEPTTAQMTDAYAQIIRRLQARGIRVLLGTLQPNGKTGDGRLPINEWVRGRSAADAIVDFDAAVRDPADPSKILATYDSGDGLHYSLAGYEAMAEAVPLPELRDPACAVPLQARRSVRRVVVGRRTTLRVTVTRAGAPLRDATVRFGTTRARTDARGIARLRIRPARAGLRTMTVTASGSDPLKLRLRVVRRAAR